MWLCGLLFTLVTGKRIDSGFHITFSFIIGLTTGQGANVDVALTIEDTIQTTISENWVYCEAKISLEYYLSSLLMCGIQ